MHIHIAKVNGILFHGTADGLVAPGVDGEMTILKDHAPLVTTLRPGRLKVLQKGAEEVFEVEQGVLEVTKEGATVLL